MWTYWPEDAAKDASLEIGKLIDSLSDPDPKIRENAHQRLALLGESALAPMKAAIGNAAAAADQARLRTLIDQTLPVECN